MAGGHPVTPDKYVRHLPFNVIRYLCALLDPGKMWEKLVVKIPNRVNASEACEFQPRYSQLHVKLFDEKSKRPDGSPTRAILDDWGTQNVKVKHLLNVLVDAELYAAANYLSVDVLQGNKIEAKENNQTGLEAPSLPKPAVNPANPNLDTAENKSNLHDKDCDVGGRTSEDRLSYHSGGAASNQLGSGFEDLEPNTEKQQAKDLASTEILYQRLQKLPQNLDETLSQKIPYELLRNSTQNFNSDDISVGGRLIGTGGFGTVFLGYLTNNLKVAVKCLKECDGVEKQFETELSTLSTYRDHNIVLLLGYATDGPILCLVYEFMPNGSLEDRLSCKDGSEPLSSSLRIDIAIGTARGIIYLNKKGLVHRDIKTANILLDENFTPKVADFATVRALPKTSTSIQTSVVIGTSAYLAPEAIRFDISAKLDSYAFGVCLLELITGLTAMDSDRPEKDLCSHVEENCGDIMDMVDQRAGEWDEKSVHKLHDVVLKCLEHRKRIRALVEDVLPELEKLAGCSIEEYV